MAAMTGIADERSNRLKAWIGAWLGSLDFGMAPASSDASFRRYFRITHERKTWVAMDAPPTQEDSRPFVAVAELLRAAGVHAPVIHAVDLSQGFMLLEDLGGDTYLQVLTSDNADALFSDALDTLIAWQVASRPGVLPAYDAAVLHRELELFPEWYLARHLGVALTANERSQLESAFQTIIRTVLAQPRVYVHRDFMPRNLIPASPNPGVVDFQDALYGPITYDLISLFKDAFISWPEARVHEWLAEYARRARLAGLPVPANDTDLSADCDWMGLQRHLKVLGIFARIRYRDGKPQYLTDAPRFVGYIHPVLQRWPELAPLRLLFERHVLPEASCAR